MSTTPPLGHPFTPKDDAAHRAIGDYAIIGDCRTAALVARDGSLDWLCLPHFSSPSIFAALLDRDRGGRFAIRPLAPFTTERHYVDETAVLQTHFICDQGVVRLTDLMPVCSAQESRKVLQPQREVLRIIEGLKGSVEVEVLFQPKPDYGARAADFKRRGALGWFCPGRKGLLVLNSDFPLETSDGGSVLSGRATLRAGQRHLFSLTYTDTDIGVIAPLGESAELRLQATARWWRQWSGRCKYNGPYREAVIRSVLLLKLLTYTLSGAVIAAPTTSLPEEIGGQRNWDYRYCWVRDASLTLRSFMELGHLDEGSAFIAWLLHATRLTRPQLQVLYDVYGETDVPERELDYLQGYKGSRPVRVGNAAWDQLQLDVYGEIILAACEYSMRGGQLDRQERKIIQGFGEVVARRWREPDNGIWEVRGERRHHTHSKLMCWVALDGLLRMSAQGLLHVPEDRYRRERDAIREAIETRGFSGQLGSYTGVFDSEDLDAALLLMAHYGYCGAGTPRMRSTYDCMAEQLQHNGLFYRYRSGTDHLPGGEATFGVCSFWAVDYLARRGDLDEARRMFERLLDFANDVGLYAEEIDSRDGSAVGNFPQAFTHVGLINAALSIEHATRGATHS